MDYSSAFEVPVFRTAESDTPRTPAEEAADRDPIAPAVYRQPATSRIEVTTNRRGTEIIYPAARNPGVATGLTVFLLIWCVAIWACIHFKAPILFPIVFGFFGILILWFTLDAWLKVTRVTVEPGTVTVAKGYLTTGQGKTIAASEIDDVTPTIGMQGGNTVYYDVTIVRKDGKKVAPAAAFATSAKPSGWRSTLKGSLASIVRPRPISIVHVERRRLRRRVGRSVALVKSGTPEVSRNSVRKWSCAMRSSKGPRTCRAIGLPLRT